MTQGFKRLPLQGLYNARDLGGYPTASGRMTAYGVFLRSEAPRALTDGDLAFLKDYGVQTTLDFRGDREVALAPSCLEGQPWLRYVRCPTFNDQVAFGARKSKSGPPMGSFVDWRQKYTEMADSCKPWVKDTLGHLAAGAGAALYHCTTGKDRTGIISALLLGLCDVAPADIVADYCISEVYLTPVYEELRAAFLQRWPEEQVHLSDPFFKTAPEYMQALLQHLGRAYGGIRPYLEACGVEESVVEQLKKKLLGG